MCSVLVSVYGLKNELYTRVARLFRFIYLLYFTASAPSLNFVYF